MAAHAVAVALTAEVGGSIVVAYPGAAQGVAISAPWVQDMSAPEDRTVAAYPEVAVQAVSVAAGEDVASVLELPAGAVSEIGASVVEALATMTLELVVSEIEALVV